MTVNSQGLDHSRRHVRWIGAVLVVCGLAALAALLAQFGSPGDPHRAGPVVYEVTSDFSHIRIRREDSVRTLLFVSDGGEVIESQVDLDQPHRLLLPYTRFMFASYLFAPEQRRALIVGLGGGGMVHFLKRHDPNLQLDVVEIDPIIIRVADEYFDVRSEQNVRIINEDALKLLAAGGETYDAIYMDAFLGASDATDASGVPLHLKTAAFFKMVQSRLSPEGVAVFNLHRHRNHMDDVRAIRSAFPQVYVFGVPYRGNVIVAATMSDSRQDVQALRQRAAELDQTFGAGISFAGLIENMAR